MFQDFAHSRFSMSMSYLDGSIKNCINYMEGNYRREWEEKFNLEKQNKLRQDRAKCIHMNKAEN